MKQRKFSLLAKESVKEQVSIDREAERIALIHATMGKFADTGISSDEIYRERQADMEREERLFQGTQP